MKRVLPFVLAAVVGSFGVSSLHAAEAPTAVAFPTKAPTADLAAIEAKLVAKYGEAQRARARRGLRQMASLWRAEDGDAAGFESVAITHFAGTAGDLDALFNRFEGLLEQLDGHLGEAGRRFRWQSDLDVGPLLPCDEITAGYDPSAHVLDDFFANKLAFVVLLNFPLTTLPERLAAGEQWSRRQWAEARLAQRFGRRVPSAVNQAIAAATARADQYVADYNLWMHHVLDGKGQRLFPAKMRLLSHWNLRDELKANYAEGAAGLAKQHVIQQAMLRIVDQTIPAAAVNNPHVDWNPFNNQVTVATVHDGATPAPANAVISSGREPDTRYAMILEGFQALRRADPYSPAAPTHIARRFEEVREIPEVRFRAMLEQVTGSPFTAEIGRVIAQRLGRPLEPFDIWYDGFRPRSAYSEEKLNALVRERITDAASYERAIPDILVKLGFTPERARTLAASIAVDPARGSGHASEASMRSEKARLRTRVPATGMDYKGFNIAAHELGHNVEQVLSLNFVDHTLLQGVPNTAFTEAFAFVFQARDLQLLGLPGPKPEDDALLVLNDFWMTYEIAGVALVDMGMWHWMYEHPTATPAELRTAVVGLAKDVWNRYYAPVFGRKDVPLLAIYSHLVNNQLYLPDYPLGHLIAFQIEGKMRAVGLEKLGAEFERMATQGRIAPDLWMKNATGAPVGAEALLAATREALKKIAAEKP
jgi:hypothetical protein